MEINTKPMESLVTELNVLLKLLDHETLSCATEEKKTAVKNLLRQLQPSVTGKDYTYMNTSVYRNGTSFVESLFDTFDCDLRELKVEMVDQEKVPETKHTNHTVPKPSTADSPPPLPNTPPPEDYYEEAVPLSPGKMPEYITSRSSSSPPNSIEDGYYEDAENNYPTTQVNRRRKNSYNDSDALSSSYESYDEEEEEKGQRLTHQWPSEENSMAPVRDCHICAFLLRKKRFGQWAKQLTVIRENRLQCYKSSKDQSPYTDIPLSLCSVIYVPKDGRRKKHELRFSLPGGEALVLAVQSKEQAEKWLQVVRDVTGQGNGLDSPSSPMIPRKIELDKCCSSEKQTSDSDSMPSVESARDGRENGKPKRGALSELTGTVSRAAGRKITRIISFSKRKPPLPGDTRTSLDQDPRCGYVGVLLNQCWKEQWCRVRAGSLYLYHEKGEQRVPHTTVALKGCEVVPGLGPKHPFALRILKGGAELAALEASCSEDMGRWLGVLLAETGSSADPESLHYDYVDVETIANIRTAARHSFLWATSTDSRMYDEVPFEAIETDPPHQMTDSFMQENERLRGGAQTKHHSSFSSSNTGKPSPQISLKRHGSNANQYGRYGKTRAQEDARRYLKEKEDLEKEIDRIRSALVSLRKKKREAKEKMKAATDKQKLALEERVARLEDSCRVKEGERVDIELKLTQVKENLKKSLAGGDLGAPTETKPTNKTQRTETQYIESFLPVNCASEIRKRPPSIYASTKGNVMQKAKVNTSVFTTLCNAMHQKTDNGNRTVCCINSLIPSQVSNEFH
uniref:Actin filament-associated protein 1-like 1 n=1 Tax=Cyprinus carpio TaxID=7962 RepID=A0A8C1IGY2_CYPCA